ncbi:fungal hydrophobin [Aspergillus heteromorphus CBS 117.55]|uniref:Hydrophobin n=1 Tax=Aspergillus heteromorphus CBS 117.55 TaxID=1448321 RepID=A0A317WJR0_9EURO|nr:fungal hydrophobin [Aspergillus heteromorphus CBS 117.55]PWY85901.1 fungal hydrophobin [Aspergillus heteromorphus CBS 117.55]
MKFTAIALALATLAVARPSTGTTALKDQTDGGKPTYPIPDDWTVDDGAAKCGDQAELSCCNQATYAGDSTNVDDGILAGLLSNLVAGGSGSQGVGVANDCSKIDVNIPIIAVGAQDFLNQQCKQNVACCQKSGSDSSTIALPCIALGSVL